MKHLSLFFTLCAALLLLATESVYAQKPHKGAYIEIAESVHDFGSISRQSSDKEHIFHIVNSGSEPLVILSASTSCSCIKVDFSRKPIPAGGESEVKITIEPRKVDKGIFHRIVQLYSNAANGTAILTIKGLAE